MKASLTAYSLSNDATRNPTPSLSISLAAERRERTHDDCSEDLPLGVRRSRLGGTPGTSLDSPEWRLPTSLAIQVKKVPNPFDSPIESSSLEGSNFLSEHEKLKQTNPFADSAFISWSRPTSVVEEGDEDENSSSKTTNTSSESVVTHPKVEILEKTLDNLTEKVLSLRDKSTTEVKLAPNFVRRMRYQNRQAQLELKELKNTLVKSNDEKEQTVEELQQTAQSLKHKLSVAEEVIEEKNRLLNTWQSNYFKCNQELEDTKTKLTEAQEMIQTLQQQLRSQLQNVSNQPTPIDPVQSQDQKDVVQSTPINSPTSSAPSSRKGSEIEALEYPIQSKPGITIVRRTSMESKALKSEDELDGLFCDSSGYLTNPNSVTSSKVNRERSYAGVHYLRKSSGDLTSSNTPSPSTSVSSVSKSNSSSVSSTPLSGASPLSPTSMNTLRTYISQHLHPTPSVTTNTPASVQSLSSTTSPRDNQVDH